MAHDFRPIFDTFRLSCQKYADSLPSMDPIVEMQTACIVRFRWRRKPRSAQATTGISSSTRKVLVFDIRIVLLPGCRHADKSEGYETFFFKTPLTHLSPLSLDDFILYDKDILVRRGSLHFPQAILMMRSLAGRYRVTHGLATRKPDHHRVEDVLGYPADYYVWVVGGSTVFLTFLLCVSKRTSLRKTENDSSWSSR